MQSKSVLTSKGTSCTLSLDNSRTGKQKLCCPIVEKMLVYALEAYCSLFIVSRLGLCTRDSSATCSSQWLCVARSACRSKADRPDVEKVHHMSIALAQKVSLMPLCN